MATKTVRAPMPRSRRAKQFMPFDALRGLKEAIAAKERITMPRRYLSEDAISEINKVLISIHKGSLITVVYYDENKLNYTQITGIVTGVEDLQQNIRVGEFTIFFSDMLDLVVHPCSVGCYKRLFFNVAD